MFPPVGVCTSLPSLVFRINRLTCRPPTQFRVLRKSALVSELSLFQLPWQILQETSDGQAMLLALLFGPRRDLSGS